MAVSRRKTRIQISPPQNVYFSKIRFSIGDDPLVKVVPLVQLPDGSYLVTLRVNGTQKARALATLLVLEKNLGGGIIVRVQVRNQKGRLIGPIRRALSSSEIAQLFRVAFKTNRLFEFAAVRRLPLRAVFPVFKADVIQFFASNLADFFANINEVAAFVFGDVLRTTINQTSINFSTAEKN